MYEDLGFSKVDYDREERTGYPEIIYGEGKTAEQITLIAEKLVERMVRFLSQGFRKKKQLT